MRCCMEKVVKQRTCELCGDEMIRVRTISGFGGMPQLETFRCVGCGDVQTFEAGLGAASSAESSKRNEASAQDEPQLARVWNSR